MWYIAGIMGGVRQTKQRSAILGRIRQADGPLSIAQIHERAGEEIPGLGIATVYRTVKALREGGEIVTVDLPGEEPHYEAADRGHHHHFRCRVCEQTYDLGLCPVGIPRGTMLPGGYTVEDHSLTLYGRCAACAA